MKQLKSLIDIRALRETSQLECKLAAGKDGKGQIPEDFWKTYSAFANTQGGVIILGVLEEKNFKFKIAGVDNVDKLKTDLFNLLNNVQKVSRNIVDEVDVVESLIDGKNILSVYVRRASRKERPVYVGSNPMTGTYRRVFDGDRLCDNETVKRFIAEQVEDSRDRQILEGFEPDCLDKSSISVFRQELRNARPTHLALESDGVEFLRIIGAWRRDRDTKKQGVTIAGLLMFGKLHDIWEIYPNYILDYQEQARSGSDGVRWTDRLTMDGTWSGNLFDFYRRTYRKLIDDLKVPFALESGRRKDETEIHVALREALVNAIIHADYSGPASVLVIKRPDAFSFRNPGHMRVPPDIARQGGDGDARNRLLQHMFFLIGASDRAGTGVPTIYRGWKERGWLPPSFSQIDTPSDQTRLDLRMTDLLPTGVLDNLRKTFGSKFDRLSANQRMVLATAATEIIVTNSRMQEVCDLHRSDITKMLQILVKSGYLIQAGKTSGTFYHLPGSFDFDLDFEKFFKSLDDEVEAANVKSEGLPAESDRRPSESDRRDAESEGLAPILSQPITFNEDAATAEARDRRPVISDLAELPQTTVIELELIASKSRMSGRLDLNEMRNITHFLCRDHFLTVRCIASLLMRDERHVRNKLIGPLVSEGRLLRAYPDRPSDPRQAYAASFI